MKIKALALFLLSLLSLPAFAESVPSQQPQLPSAAPRDQPVHAGQVDPVRFAQHKQQIIAKMKSNQACVEAAQSPEALRNCRPARNERHGDAPRQDKTH